jgi:hypothetical protein
MAIAFSAPLGDPANPGISPNPAKAPWYFLGFQELLIHFDATFAILLIPLLAFIPYEANIAGDWFLTDKGKRMAAVATITALLLVPLWIVVDDKLIGPDGWLPGTASIISNGVLPFGLLVGGLSAFYVLMGRFFAATRIEKVQSLFVLLFVAFVVLTVTGVWFRGPSMMLVWPWQT